MGELSKLPNIGKTLEEQLAQVGINCAADEVGLGEKPAMKKATEKGKYVKLPH